MSKELTPMQDLLQDLKETKITAINALNDINDLNIITACKNVVTRTLNVIIDRIETELLPKEKQVIKDAFTEGYTDGYNGETTYSKDYYNNKFKKRLIMKTKKLIYVLFIIASVLCAVGCSGTRKASTQIDKVDLKTDTELQTKEVDNTKTKTDVYTYTEKQETTEIETIEPIDANKPFTYNGTEYKNTKITKRKTNVLSKEKSKVNQVVQNDKKAVKKERVKAKANVKTKTKEVVSEKGNFWNWIILIILVLAFAYWFYWSRKIVRDKENLEL